jgi:hypothetical protein
VVQIEGQTDVGFDLLVVRGLDDFGLGGRSHGQYSYSGGDVGRKAFIESGIDWGFLATTSGVRAGWNGHRLDPFLT